MRFHIVIVEYKLSTYANASMDVMVISLLYGESRLLHYLSCDGTAALNISSHQFIGYRH